MLLRQRNPRPLFDLLSIYVWTMCTLRKHPPQLSSIWLRHSCVGYKTTKRSIPDTSLQFNTDNPHILEYEILRMHHPHTSAAVNRIVSVDTIAHYRTVSPRGGIIRRKWNISKTRRGTRNRSILSSTKRRSWRQMETPETALLYCGGVSRDALQCSLII